jgi:hypothetical protein
MFIFPSISRHSCGEALALTMSQALSPLGWKESSGSKPILCTALETAIRIVLLNSIVVQRWTIASPPIQELLFGHLVEL